MYMVAYTDPHRLEPLVLSDRNIATNWSRSVNNISLLEHSKRALGISCASRNQYPDTGVLIHDGETFNRVVHQSVESVGKEFYELLRRRVWVTPMSYLELLGSFKRQLGRKRADVGRNRSRLQVGSTNHYTSICLCDTDSFLKGAISFEHSWVQDPRFTLGDWPTFTDGVRTL